MSGALRVCLVGLGEVGRILAADLRPCVASLAVWDIQFPAPGSAPRDAAAALGLEVTRHAGEAITGADLVISAVTAAQCVNAARTAAPHLKRGAAYLDLNSVSPAVRVEAATCVAEAGGRFIESAVMSPIQPLKLGAPMLLGGPQAAPFADTLRSLGFTGAQVFSEKLGAASAAKMCRSVVVKGLEALMLESLLTARHFGVEDTVVESLRGWLGRDTDDDFAHYMIGRTLVHGRRRAEEMREVARSVREAGLEPRMSEACARWQDWAGGRTGAAAQPLAVLLDELRKDVRREVA